MGKGLLFIVLGKDAGEDAESEEHCKTLSKDRQKHLAGSNTSPPIPRHHIPTNALKNKFLSNRDGKVFIPNISGLEKNKTKSFLTFFFFFFLSGAERLSPRCYESSELWRTREPSAPAQEPDCKAQTHSNSSPPSWVWELGLLSAHKRVGRAYRTSHVLFCSTDLRAFYTRACQDATKWAKIRANRGNILINQVPRGD